MYTAIQGSFRVAPLQPRRLATTSATTSLLNSEYGRTNRIRIKNKRQYPRQRGMTCKAMVNVDVSPSVILGVGLIGSGVSLWQIRQSKPWISKDYDVVISCISLLVGGILIFQGWRLDPLLLFGQLMTTGAALSFAVEALRLRNEVYEQDEEKALRDAMRRGAGTPRQQSETLLPPPPPPRQGYEEYSYSVDDDEGVYDYSRASSYGFGSIGRRDAVYTDADGGYIDADYYDASSTAVYEDDQGDYDDYDDDSRNRPSSSSSSSNDRELPPFQPRSNLDDLGDNDDF